MKGSTGNGKTISSKNNERWAESDKKESQDKGRRTMGISS